MHPTFRNFFRKEGAVPRNVGCIEDDLLNYTKLS